MLRTIGLDIASKGSKSAICCLEWDSSGVQMIDLDVGHFSNEKIVTKIQHLREKPGSDDCYIGIDAPFGFPISFTDAVLAMVNITAPPQETQVWRLTECWIKENLSIQPLSCTTSLITDTIAGRCLPVRYKLAAQNALSDLIGYSTKIFEVYPASALVSWKAPLKTQNGTSSYKKNDSSGNEAKQCIVEFIFGMEKAPGGDSWLQIPSQNKDEYWKLLHRSDDAIDALVCALTARIVSDPSHPTDPAALGVFSKNELDQIQKEGWIHVPPEGSLKELARAHRAVQ